MDRQYDIFEKLPNGAVWKCAVVGHEAAVRKLKELAAQTKNEVYMIYLPTLAVAARMNASSRD